MLQKRWALVEESPEDGWLRSANTKPALAQVLHNRGFADPQAAQQFLHSRDLHEAPLAMKDMPKAVERINRALLCGELIAIYGDYDADGVCATALLLTTLQKLGGNAIAHIPHRDAGYGLSKGALNRLAEAGARLVVTVDCGIRSVAEVAAGNAL
ncbi:MAG: single-stranded-DNA-specific exonuclease RecJ, partial [Chloroflexi bacterium]|nr:single-stranded-DNA-specific exonuclease RecJ [Chloroflexota bacterium]